MLTFLIILIITYDYGIGEREIGELLLNFLVNLLITDICATNYMCSKIGYLHYTQSWLNILCLRFQFGNAFNRMHGHVKLYVCFFIML